MNEFARLIAPFARRIANLLARGTVAAVNAASKMQGLQVRLLAGEVKDGVEHFEPYGFTSHPQTGAEAIGMFFDGDRSHGIVIVVADRRYRLQALEAGEVALHDDQGQKIHLKRTGIVAHTPFTFRVEADVIQLHASSLFQFDCNGHGQKWYPTKIDTWQIGETAGTAHAISPPEI